MRRFRRTRRPLVALVALILLLAIGYAVRGCDDTSGGSHSAGSVLPHTGGRALSPALR
ncbi:MAG TPA: hypothetical protein VHC23_11360 [Jatrophihabitans sp.]|nr:hypothetical protein [Jatrophihabitans sp.]